MCGITGFVGPETSDSTKVLKDMVQVLSHRGPDNIGFEKYHFDDKEIGFAQARLSIIDLNEGANQPMDYKHFSIVFNGEIYNFKEIKSDLIDLGHEFITNSDTEVILHAFEEWRMEAVHRFIGMFAFCVLDKAEKKIFCFRDRAGVKPFYYYANGSTFLFASELKSFHNHPHFHKEIDTSAVMNYFDLGYISGASSIFLNCYKLLPATQLTYNISTGSIDLKSYWNVSEYYAKPKLDISFDEAKKSLDSLLKSAFKYRMVADVPIGVFLSGGYDSTAVTALLSASGERNLKTFTIGFMEGNNEAPFAKQTAEFLGTQHEEYYFNSKEAQEIVPTLPYYFDEPFSDSSAIPTIMVSRLAKNKVSVALSADGGDEIFSGYNFYRRHEDNLNLLNKVPKGLKGISSGVLNVVEKVIPSNQVELRHKLSSLALSMDKNRQLESAKLFYHSHALPSQYVKKLFKFNNETVMPNYLKDAHLFENTTELAMAIDYKYYLPDDILTKVDRATMSVSLEGREPLLDHRLIEFVAQLPLSYKFDGKESKKLLKSIVHDYVPKKMMDRPKTGFSMPIYSWLRGDLSYLIDQYLNKEALAESGLFNVGYVSKLIAQFKNERLYYVTLIWKLLMFQMWYFKWMKK